MLGEGGGTPLLTSLSLPLFSSTPQSGVVEGVGGVGGGRARETALERYGRPEETLALKEGLCLGL